MSNEKKMSIEEEIDNWKPVESDFPKFWDFREHPIFVGKYLNEYEYKNPETDEVQVSGFLFEDMEGFKFIINGNYQIEKAIEKYGVKKYKIEFTGQTKISGNKKINNFKIAVAETI